jgi:predicted Zn-dependent peptidase
LVFVGDISLQEATNLARQNFGSWSGGAAPAVNIPASKPMGAAKFILLTAGRGANRYRTYTSSAAAQSG